MFDETMHLRYTDRQARDFMARPHDKSPGASNHDDLRIEVSHLAAEVLEQAASRTGGNSVPFIRPTKAIRTSQGPFRLRGIWVAGGAQTKTSCHVLIVISDDVVNHTGVQAEV